MSQGFWNCLSVLLAEQTSLFNCSRCFLVFNEYTRGVTRVALYKNPAFVAQSDSAEFDKIYHPGQRCRWSGIYRCLGCGLEIVHTASLPLPPLNHHQHASNQGPICWELVVTDYT